MCNVFLLLIVKCFHIGVLVGSQMKMFELIRDRLMNKIEVKLQLWITQIGKDIKVI